MDSSSNRLSARDGVNFPIQESPISRPATRSSSSAKWELGWQDPDAMLKISVFDEDHVNRPKGAPQKLRDKLKKMEQAMMTFGVGAGRRVKSSATGRKRLEVFRRVVKSVILLLKCFRQRRKFAVQSNDMTLRHSERIDGFEIFKTSSLSRELQTILSTPPEYRSEEDLRKVQFYLRATGASRLLASASTPEDLDNLSRYVAYERYENDRVVVQQGRTPDRFYFVVTGKLLIVKEYHIDTGIISKTVGVLTKGMTTNVEEMEQRTLRKASMVCRGPVETLVLDNSDYFLIHGERGGAPREFLSRHVIFKSFPFNSIKCHRHLIRLQYFPKGAVIFEGGEEFEWIYAVKSGECSLVRVQMVADLKRRNNPLFNKRTVEEMGCQRVRRAQSAAEKRADFRMWRGPSRQTLSVRTEKPFSSPRMPSKERHSRREDIRGNSSATIQEERDQSTNDMNSPKKTLPRIFVDSGSESLSSIALSDPPSPRTHSARDYINDRMTATADVKNPTIAPTLSRSRFSSSLSPKNMHENRPKRTTAGPKSAPPALRQAYLELGKLRSGDVLGLEDAKLQIEDLPHIRLISDTGAEVVLLNRKFFLRNAPTSLLSKISYQTGGYPSIGKARSDYETLEAWSIYKTSLMRVLKSRGNIPEQSRTQKSRGTQIRECGSFVNSRKARSTLNNDDYRPRYIPPGTADRSKTSRNETSHRLRRPKLYTSLGPRSVYDEKPQLLSDPSMKYVKGFRISMVSN